MNRRICPLKADRYPQVPFLVGGEANRDGNEAVRMAKLIAESSYGRDRGSI